MLLDISTDTLTQLRKESIENISFTVGEIYRTLKSYQISQNAALEQKWSFVDSNSICHIEGLISCISLTDQKYVTNLIDSKELFPLIRITEDRKILKTRALYYLCLPKFKESFKKLFAYKHFVYQGSHIRHIEQSFEWSTKDINLNKLAILASQLDFKSNQISLLRNKNLS
ncbi:unnamed protein product [Penicillium salamii]|nr:unnamed protein product [Penicillium salamii]